MKFDKEQVKKAQEQGLVLLSFEIDSRHSLPKRNSYNGAGAVHPDCADELLAMVNRWIAEGKF